MPGRLRSSFRSGNLAEHLGLLLLKGIAAVAEVARPEDVGLDAVATLLRRDQDGNCYAEDTFGVQFKSDSETVLVYQGHELDWLIGQPLPMFIGKVCLKTSRISLYSTLFVNQAVLSLHSNKVSIRFGVSDMAPFLVGQKWSAWKSESEHGALVWLGAPIVEWGVDDLTKNDRIKLIYSVLKAFLGLARKVLNLVACGQISVLDWSTNDILSVKCEWGLQKGGQFDSQSLGDRCAPGIHALALQMVALQGEQSKDVIQSMVSLVTSLRGVGVEIDPHNLIKVMYRMHG